MRRHRRRHNQHADLEAELRSQRPEPSSDLVDAIAARVTGTHRPPRRTLRLAFAGALVAVAAFAALGGIGFTGSGGGVKDEAAPEAAAVTTAGTGRHVATGSAQPATVGCSQTGKASGREKQERRVRRTEELRSEIAACQPGQPRRNGD